MVIGAWGWEAKTEELADKLETDELLSLLALLAVELELISLSCAAAWLAGTALESDVAVVSTEVVCELSSLDDCPDPVNNPKNLEAIEVIESLAVSSKPEAAQPE